MSYITVQEAAKKWGISERLVRRYCAEGRIQDLAQYDGIWQIPEDADKPSRIKKDTINTPQIPPLLKNLIKQRDGRQYRGLYDYIQINNITHSWGGTAQFAELPERQRKVIINLAP